MSEWWEQTPKGPTEPTEPTPPTQPTEPQEPEVPATPDVPAEPTAPEVPVQPTEPTEPPAWNVPPTRNEWSIGAAPYAPTQPQPSAPPPRPRNNATIIVAAVLATVCVVCLTFGALLLFDRTPTTPSQAGSPTTTTTTTKAQDTDAKANENVPSVVIHDATEDDGGLTTTEIVSRNLDSTVVVNMYTTSTAQYGSFSFNTETETMAGTASGIVMSEDGYIITNQHVAVNEKTGQPYSRLEVVLYSGATYTATLVGSDKDTDLAVIKIEATGLKPATFGNSSKMSIGDRVVTLGNAGGLEWSASQGILSGTKRDVYEKTGYSIQCLQIDAAINPGNSGGPLLNSQGQVIGINSAKIVYTGYESLGFSIPIDEAQPIINDLIRYGYVTGRVELGIKGYTITQTGYEGFMVSEINSDSSLLGADIQVNDIITSLDGQKVENRTQLRSLLSKHSVGDTVTLGILRITNQRTGETQRFEIQVTLKESRGS